MGRRRDSAPGASGASGASGTSGTSGTSAGPAPGSGPEGLNLAVLWGRCSSGVEVRTLESGQRVASLAVRTPAGAAPGRRRGAGRGGEHATSVPVTVWDPPAWLEGVAADAAVVVVGTVRRRFFATRGGGRGSRAEVQAISIARATPGQRERVHRRALAVLEALG